ncbi:major facilitator family protein [Babesia ovis]|uniref:Major facilitator family protein n=1 Tax=Babesia ovis TaxID=5869 RepID=A0A9W5TCQ5_BABOV|nr:major facilitator family protein [Babesia ovis]
MAKSVYSSFKLLTYGLAATLLYHFVFFMDGYDQQMLSLCMRAFEETLHLSPATLSVLATVESVSLVVCCIIWGYLVDIYECRHVFAIAIGCMGTACILLGCASKYALLVALRIFHGAALGCTPPALQKIVTTSTHESHHGLAFGILHACSCLGRLFSALLVTSVASLRGFKNIPGWRICYVATGIVWIVVGTLVWNFLKTDEDITQVTDQEEDIHITETLGAIFRTWTSRVLLFVFFISDAPFCAFTYMILYLQYLGLSDLSAGFSCALTLLGGLLGGGFGGYLVDLCHKKNPTYGRLIAGNVIMIVRLVASLALFLGPSANGYLPWYQILEFMIIGATLMTISSIDRPILAAVVEKKYQASAIGFNRCIAGVISSCTFMPLAGLLTEKVFGYIQSNVAISKLAEATKLTNSEALRRTMMYMTCVGTAINSLCYIIFLFTYPNDCHVNEKNRPKEEILDSSRSV